MKKLLSIVGLLLAGTGCAGVTTHDAPPGQPPLRDMDLATFKRQFNEAPGARMVVLLSPT